MKILLAVPTYLAYSYINQAQALAKGFTELNHHNQLAQVNDPQDLVNHLNAYHPDIVIGVGNWSEYDLFVNTPNSLGYKSIPWVVVDEDRIDRYIEQYNQHQNITTPSQKCKNSLTNSGINEKFITVIPEAVDPCLWFPMNERDLQPFLEYMTLPINNPLPLDQLNMVNIHQQKIPVVYTTGGDATKKGCQEVIQALAQLDRQIPWVYVIKSWPIAVVFKRSIEELELAKKVGIIDRIRYISAEYSQTYMRALMNICDIYAAPSRIEGFGLPHVEAQMCGKPVISLATTATQETVIHGQTGFHSQRDFSETNFAKADINDLAKHLHTLITDSSRRLQMGQNAIQHARNTFSPKVIAQKFIDLINQS